MKIKSFVIAFFYGAIYPQNFHFPPQKPSQTVLSHHQAEGINHDSSLELPSSFWWTVFLSGWS